MEKKATEAYGIGSVLHGRVMTAALLIAVFGGGCTNTVMQPVSGTAASEVHVSISVGDTVRVLTKHGVRQTFEVVEIKEETLGGEDQSIRYDEMAFIEKKIRAKRNEDAIAGAVILILLGGIVVGIAVNDVGFQLPAGTP